MDLPIASHWFDTTRVDHTITLLWEPHVHEFIRCNIWHVRGRDRSLVVDTGLGIACLRDAAPELFAGPIVAVATHTHYDHVGGLHEFEERAVHPLDITLETEARFASLVVPAYFAADGLVEGDLLLAALPHAGFDPAAYMPSVVQPTRIVDEGDALDLGDRAFEVLHLPGHSPGSIGLWDAGSGVLFSGDTVYDGQLLDTLPGSNIADYVATMKRLRELPVSVVHSGHGASFGRPRMLELIDAYLGLRDS